MDDAASTQNAHNISQETSNVFVNQEDVIAELANNFKIFTDLTISRIQQLNRDIDQLNSQMQQVLNAVSTIQSRRESLPQQKPQPSPKAEQQEQSQESPVEKEEPKEEKPYYEKQGHFTPDDVKIDEIFYCGNK